MTPNLEQIEARLNSIAQRVAILRRLGQNAAAKLECIPVSTGLAVGQIAICLNLQQEFLDEIAAEIGGLSSSPGLQLSAAAFSPQRSTDSFLP